LKHQSCLPSSWTAEIFYGIARMNARPLPIAVTLGDPAGIGPEIIAKLFSKADGLPAAIVIGDAGVLRRTVSAQSIALDVQVISQPEHARCAHGTVEVLQPHEPLPVDLPVGRVDPRCGRAAFESISRAIDLARAGRVRAITTAPINKEAMRLAGIHYPGHTEILADLGGAAGETAMMLANDELRVVLVTVHLALRQAIDAITVERELATIRLAHGAAKRLGIEAPRVAVAGLNPHAGENGLFGREDLDTIGPAIALAKSENIDASGPWPGDTVFMRARTGEFDVVVAQYHDQGLIPVKYLGVDRGVNITLGLPFIRTSVDHGTAFDIAGRGIADPASLREALQQAAMLTADKLPRQREQSAG
jgi:4-hydroxythreonine-4-phosphate dehydrogenase